MYSLIFSPLVYFSIFTCSADTLTCVKIANTSINEITDKPLLLIVFPLCFFLHFNLFANFCQSVNIWIRISVGTDHLKLSYPDVYKRQVLYCAFRGRHSNGRRSGGNRRIKRSIHDRLSGGVSSAPLEYPILRLGVLASAPSDNYANNGGYVDIAAESKF